MRWTRRAFLAATASAATSQALGRRPYGGVLRLSLPFAFDALDPHAGDDPASALLAASIADPLYAWDGAGHPYPALAAAPPEPVQGGCRIALRPGLVTALGRPLDANDVLFSLARARDAAARPLLAAFGAARRVPRDPLSVVIAGATPDALSDALASPVTAIVPRGFSPRSPDGTGAFRVTRRDTGLWLERNERAARGPSFLDRIEVATEGLAALLRAFESGDADIGFLGAGLHKRRSGAVDFTTPAAALVVLGTGALAGSWGAPGVAERLVSGVDPSRVAHLGLSPPGARGSSTAWGGASADLLVDAGSDYLIEVARVVASTLTAPGHEIRPLPLPRTELRARHADGRYALCIDVVRLLGPTPRLAQLSLLAAADPRLAERPPPESDLATMARTLPLAPLGDLTVRGARVPDVHGLEQWDLGSVYRDPRA